MWPLMMLILGCRESHRLEATVYFDWDRNDQKGETADSDENNTEYTLLHRKTIEVENAQIWNGIVDNDQSLHFLSMSANKLSIREFDHDLNALSDFDPITSEDDYPEGNRIADHAVLKHEDQLYILITGNSDNYLALFSCKPNGQRTGFYEIQNESDIPANDPHLVSDGESICARWGDSGYEKRVLCFDADLNPLSNVKTVETPSPVPQLGATLFVESEYWSFTGAPSQRDLIYTRYDKEWTPLSPFEVTILRSENFEWNWFPSGVVHIEEKDLWVMAYTNMHADDWDKPRGRLALFDGQFNMLEYHIISSQNTYRPHLMVSGDKIFVSLDAGPVVLQRWDLVQRNQSE